MSRPERESRLAENEAAQELASQPTTASSTDASATTAEPVHLIGATVETRLAAELARLVADEITLDAFTPALQNYVLHGHRLAMASLLPEYTRLEVALAQAQAAAGQSQQNGQRIDQLNGRVDGLDQQMQMQAQQRQRKPRG